MEGKTNFTSKIVPSKTSSKLATAQGSSLTNFGKILLFLIPTQTMEQNSFLIKPFKQTFHITDIKYNIVGIPFITKNITNINILNSKTHKRQIHKNKKLITYIFTKTK